MLTKIDNFIYQLERIFITTALITMTLVVFTQVVLRYVFGQGLPWAEELARYLMIWAGFLGASIATRQKRHIRVDILPRLLSSKKGAQIFLTRIAYFISACFCFFLCKVGYQLVSHSHTVERVSTSMELPMWIVQLGIPLTSFIIACRFLAHAFGRAESLVAADMIDKELRHQEIK